MLLYDYWNKSERVSHRKDMRDGKKVPRDIDKYLKWHVL